jgi:hypothetical protein
MDTTTNHEQPPRSQAAVQVAMVVVASLLLVSIITISYPEFCMVHPFCKSVQISLHRSLRDGGLTSE